MVGVTAARGLIGVLLFVAVSASLLPLVETNVWWVRYLDFPRVQFAIALLILTVLLIAIGGATRVWGLVALVFSMVALGYHAYKLIPYTPLVAPLAAAELGCVEGERLELLVANVQQSNETSEELFRIVEEVDPDVFIVLETDPWWDAALADMTGRFPYSAQFVPEGEDTGAFGMHLLSSYKLIGVETMFYFGNDTPTIIANLALPGGAAVQVVAVHPRPPLY